MRTDYHAKNVICKVDISRETLYLVLLEKKWRIGVNGFVLLVIDFKIT